MYSQDRVSSIITVLVLLIHHCMFHKNPSIVSEYMIFKSFLVFQLFGLAFKQTEYVNSCCLIMGHGQSGPGCLLYCCIPYMWQLPTNNWAPSSSCCCTGLMWLEQGTYFMFSTQKGDPHPFIYSSTIFCFTAVKYALSWQKNRLKRGESRNTQLTHVCRLLQKIENLETTILKSFIIVFLFVKNIIVKIIDEKQSFHQLKKQTAIYYILLNLLA